MTFLALQNGASQAEVIQPDNIFLQRLKEVAEILSLTNKIEINPGYFPETAPLSEPDFIICTGVLYHAINIEDFLEKLLNFRKPILLESTYDLNEDGVFDPRFHNDGYSSNTSIHLSWLRQFLKDNQFKIIELEIYNSRCLKLDYYSPYNTGDRRGTRTIRRWASYCLPIN
jgi:hypothetical protein